MNGRTMVILAYFSPPGGVVLDPFLSLPAPLVEELRVLLLLELTRMSGHVFASKLETFIFRDCDDQITVLQFRGELARFGRGFRQVPQQGPAWRLITWHDAGSIPIIRAGM